MEPRGEFPHELHARSVAAERAGAVVEERELRIVRGGVVTPRQLL